MVLESYIANDYLRAFVIFIVLLILLQIGFYILTRIFLRLVSKTKTDLDDVIIKKSIFPVTVIAFFISLRLAIDELNLGAGLHGNISMSIYTAIIVFVGYLIYTLIDVIVLEIWGKFTTKAKIQAGESLAGLILGIVKVTTIALIFLYVLDLWGVEITPLLAGLGIAGLAVALALQPILANIFSGIAVIMDKTVSVGDLIKLDTDTSGKILKIGLRSTKIRTFDNEVIFIPNTVVAESNVQNVALPDKRIRVVIPFGVEYGSDIEKVKKIVMKEIKTLTHVLKDPEPHIKFIEMADSSLNFKAYFYINTFENKLSSTDEANTKIYNALNKNKIEIPYPQMDVHMKKK